MRWFETFIKLKTCNVVQLRKNLCGLFKRIITPFFFYSWPINMWSLWNNCWIASISWLLWQNGFRTWFSWTVFHLKCGSPELCCNYNVVLCLLLQDIIIPAKNPIVVPLLLFSVVYTYLYSFMFLLNQPYILNRGVFHSLVYIVNF